jgi:Thiamine pyrophosphokinase
LLDSNNKIYLKKQSFTIKKEEQYGDYVSLLPFCEKVTGLTLKGFKYPLNNITYMTGSSLGISNVITEKIGVIEISDGILLVNETRD